EAHVDVFQTIATDFSRERVPISVQRRTRRLAGRRTRVVVGRARRREHATAVDEHATTGLDRDAANAVTSEAVADVDRGNLHGARSDHHRNLAVALLADRQHLARVYADASRTIIGGRALIRIHCSTAAHAAEGLRNSHRGAENSHATGGRVESMLERARSP